MTAIVVQTVDLVDGANSYTSVNDVIAYAADRGITLTSPQVSPLIFKSMDIIERNYFNGYLVDSSQSTQAPRDGVCDLNTKQYFSRQQVLDMFKIAQAELIIQLAAGYDPYGVSTVPRVKSETFGPFSTTYTDDSFIVDYLQQYYKILAPFIAGVAINGIHFKIKGPVY